MLDPNPNPKATNYAESSAPFSLPTNQLSILNPPPPPNLVHQGSSCRMGRIPIGWLFLWRMFIGQSDWRETENSMLRALIGPIFGGEVWCFLVPNSNCRWHFRLQSIFIWGLSIARNPITRKIICDFFLQTELKCYNGIQIETFEISITK